MLLIAALLPAGCAREPEERQVQSEESVAPGETARETSGGEQPEPAGEAVTETDRRHEKPARLPRLVDLGRNTCVPCKMMAPILEEVSREYSGRAVVEVIDLREHQETAREYGIRLIPTQIFFDADGNEVWRHEGFLGKDEIIAKFTEMGVAPIGN